MHDLLFLRGHVPRPQKFCTMSKILKNVFGIILFKNMTAEKTDVEIVDRAFNLCTNIIHVVACTT